MLRHCGSSVEELSSGDGDYRDSTSVLRLPNFLIFLRFVQFTLDSLGVGIELETQYLYMENGYC